MSIQHVNAISNRLSLRPPPRGQARQELLSTEKNMSTDYADYADSLKPETIIPVACCLLPAAYSLLPTFKTASTPHPDCDSQNPRQIVLLLSFHLFFLLLRERLESPEGAFGQFDKYLRRVTIRNAAQAVLFWRRITESRRFLVE